MRFDKGFVIVSRGLGDVDKYDGWDMAIMLWLIMHVNYKDGTKKMGSLNRQPVLRGQILTSISELTEALGFGRQLIGNRLSALEKDGTIVQRTSKQGRLITLCNYEKYQCIESYQTERSSNANGTLTERSSNANEYNELKNKSKQDTKGNKRASVEAALSDQEISIATKWLEYSKREMPWKSEDPKWNVTEWAHALVELKKKTDLNDEGLERVLEFVSNDHFWAKNAVSPKMLLAKSKSNGQRKIDNILVNLRTKGDRDSEKLKTWIADQSPEAFDSDVPF